MIRMSKVAMRKGSATTSQLAEMVSTSPAKATRFEELFGRVSSVSVRTPRSRGASRKSRLCLDLCKMRPLRPTPT